MNILDHYSSEELRGFYDQSPDKWPEKLRNMAHNWLAQELLDSWLSNADDDQYEDRMLDIIQSEIDHADD